MEIEKALISPITFKVSKSGPMRFEGGGCTSSSSDFDRDLSKVNGSNTMIKDLYHNDMLYIKYQKTEDSTVIRKNLF